MNWAPPKGVATLYAGTLALSSQQQRNTNLESAAGKASPPG
jgi:hypothetical protein